MALSRCSAYLIKAVVLLLVTRTWARPGSWRLDNRDAVDLREYVNDHVIAQPDFVNPRSAVEGLSKPAAQRRRRFQCDLVLGDADDVRG